MAFFVSLLKDICAQDPLTLILQDVHWIDRESHAYLDAMTTDDDNAVIAPGFVAGYKIMISGFERVFTGDGQDRIHDEAGANILRGGRGNGTLRDTSAGGDDLVITGAVLSVSHDCGGGTDRINWRNRDVQNVTFDQQAGAAGTLRGPSASMTNFGNLIGSGISPGARIRSRFPVRLI
ncbi:MAG: hypothetical protein COC12_01885 [Rhodobacteraceae bacterium]|nr:MAG: hypothetical protein COC12_01885 [Paracoccaceae bacterium]